MSELSLKNTPVNLDANVEVMTKCAGTRRDALPDDLNINAHALNTSKPEDIEMIQEVATESSADLKPKNRKARRTKAEIDAEYQKFKELYNSGHPVLEISLILDINNTQCNSHLSKITTENNNSIQKYGVCKGFNLPEGVRKMLGGNKDDLFKFASNQDGVVITIHKC